MMRWSHYANQKWYGKWKAGHWLTERYYIIEEIELILAFKQSEVKKFNFRGLTFRSLSRGEDSRGIKRILTKQSSIPHSRNQTQLLRNEIIIQSGNLNYIYIFLKFFFHHLQKYWRRSRGNKILFRSKIIHSTNLHIQLLKAKDICRWNITPS